MPGYILSLEVVMPDIADALFDHRQGTVISLEVTAGAKTAVFPSDYNVWRRTVGCRVTELAAGGSANRAVMALVANTLGIPRSSVTIRSGHTLSQKTLLIHGLERQKVMTILKDKMQ